jgi:hypothetical protein
MAARAVLAAFLRDAAKRPLLRMRSVLRRYFNGATMVGCLNALAFIPKSLVSGFSSPGIDLSQLFHVANARAIRFQLRYIGLL